MTSADVVVNWVWKTWAENVVNWGKDVDGVISGTIR